MGLTVITYFRYWQNKKERRNGSHYSSQRKKNLYGIIKQVVTDSQPVEIWNTNDDESVVIISKRDWNSIQETIYLQNAGVMERIKHFENEDLDKIDWDNS